jgi:hypothetical protein
MNMKKRMNKGNKKAQEIFGLSFGMIFSIILIIFFVVVAGIAIKHFYSTMNCGKVGIFINDLQDEVDGVWNAEEHLSTFNGVLPSGVEQVCFSDTKTTKGFYGPDKDIGIDIDIYPDDNLFLIPLNKACDMGEVNVKHINITAIISRYNPYCLPVKNGKVKMVVEKNSNEALVRIK